MSQIAISATRIAVETFIGAAQMIEAGLIKRSCSSSMCMKQKRAVHRIPEL